MAQTNSSKQMTRFQTVMKHVIYRSKGGNALTAKLVIATHGEEKTGLIQLGRYAKNYEASKYMVCLKREEAEWMVNSLPALKKNARSVKVVKDPVVLDEKEFSDSRGLKYQAVKLDQAITKQKFQSKNVEMVQSFIRDDDFLERSVTISITNLPQVERAVKHLMLAMDVYFSIEQKLEATENIFMSYLGYLIQTNIATALTDDFTVPYDEKLQEKMINMAPGEASRAYWFLARFISLNFNRQYAELLNDIFASLGMDHFDKERVTEENLWVLLETNWKTFMKAENMPYFEFTKFLIDNANAL